MNSPKTEKQAQLKDWIRSRIVDLVAQSATNTLGYEHEEKAWSKPLVGFSKGDDAYYHFFKQDIGHFYWLPQEAFLQGYPNGATPSEQLTVISWVIPQTRATKADQRKRLQYPSERWARSRLYGEECNNLMREQIVQLMEKAGYRAVAPMLLAAFRRETSEKYGYASSWSERHAAFVAGLGTFGLSDGLITPVGKAVRCGSVIAHLDVAPDRRPYRHHHEYCLYYFDGSCKKCVQRCPTNAIDETGHDKVKCHDYIRQVTMPFVERTYHISTSSCGLCQVKIPCDSGIPPKIKKQLDV